MPVERRLDVRLFGAVLLGCVLLHTAWTLAVPTFRGVDEYEHVYKAAAVARGDWSPGHRESPTGWGEVVVVPADLVEAARPSCESLPGTDCEPLAAAGDGLVEMHTSAGRYNPVFYAVIGTAALPFSGDGALYAMRAAAGLMCALLVALAAVTLRRWARTAWPGAALLLTATPMLTYSTTIAAPNGLEMAGALLVWCALLGLVDAAVSRRDLRFFVLTATVGAVPLLVVRSLGPLWLLLICASVLPLLTRAHLGRLLASRHLRVAAALLTAVAVAAVGYTRFAGTNAITGATEHFGRPSPADLVGQYVLWFVQTVGAFPARDELAPMPFYAVAFLIWWVVLALVLRQADRGSRAALLLVVALASAVALAVTLRSWDAAGAIWQGRYAMPLTLGFALLGGRVLDRSATPTSAGRVLTWMAVAFAALHTVAVLGVVRLLPDRGGLAGTALDGVVAPVVVVLVVVGTLSLAGGLRSTVRRSPEVERTARDAADVPVADAHSQPSNGSTEA